MRHAATCGVPRSTIFFHVISQTAGFSEIKVAEHKLCVLIFCTNLSETFLILRKIQRDVTVNVHIYRFSCKVPVIVVRFWRNLDLPNRFSKNTQILNFMKICTVGAELLHVDWQTDRQTDTRSSQSLLEILQKLLKNSILTSQYKRRFSKFKIRHPEVFNTYINIQWCISQTQQHFIMFIIVLGQHVSILIESSSGPSKKIDPYR